MTGLLFREWLENFNRSIEFNRRNVLLLVDNAGSHVQPQTLSNVTVKFLPPNTTAHFQPMDGGIIRNFKAFYRRNLGRHFLGCLEAKQAPAVCIREALILIADAWAEVKEDTIHAQLLEACWNHVW